MKPFTDNSTLALQIGRMFLLALMLSSNIASHGHSHQQQQLMKSDDSINIDAIKASNTAMEAPSNKIKDDKAPRRPDPCSDFNGYVCGRNFRGKLFGFDYLSNLVKAFAWLDLSTSPPWVHLVLGLFRECMLQNLVQGNRRRYSEVECVNTIHDDHVEVMYRIYVDWYIRWSGNYSGIIGVKDYATEVANEIRDAYIFMVSYGNERTTFIADQYSRERIERKLRQLQMLIGYPDFAIEHDSILGVVYGTGAKGFNQSAKPSESFEALQRRLLVGDFHRSRTMMKLHKAKGIEALVAYLEQGEREQYSDFKLWKDITPKIGPHYVTAGATGREGKNLLFVSLNEITKPAFSPEYPASVNFGLAASFIGHEIGHSFELAEALSQHHLNVSAPIWSLPTAVRYLNALTCLKDQYSRVPVNPSANPTRAKIMVNGTVTVMENVADLFGVIAGFKALQRYSIKNRHLAQSSRRVPTNNDKEDDGTEELEFPPDPKTFGHERAFFIAYARRFCVRPRDYWKFALDTSHSPYFIRANETLKGVSAFARTFNCPPSSAMRPRAGRKKECNFW